MTQRILDYVPSYIPSSYCSTSANAQINRINLSVGLREDSLISPITLLSSKKQRFCQCSWVRYQSGYDVCFQAHLVCD